MCARHGLNWKKRLDSPGTDHPRPRPVLSLSQDERQRVLDVLHSERFVDKVPTEVYATLLDEGIYLCSIRTMYRILAQEGEVRERRQQRRHGKYEKPPEACNGPKSAMVWDITKLKEPMKWTYFYLYDVMNVFSRYWMVRFL